VEEVTLLAGLDGVLANGGAERRTSRRYPMRLSLVYEILDRNFPISSTGETINISSKGILFTGAEEVNKETRMRLVIQWPAAVERDLRLSLFATVLWKDGTLTAARIWNYKIYRGLLANECEVAWPHVLSSESR
jgi:hypothetical protein